MLVAAWQVVALVNDQLGFYNGVLVPSPVAVGHSLIRLSADGQLWSGIAASSARVFAGLAIAVPLGVALAILTTSARIFDVLIDPVIEVLRPVPTLALLPIFILWFGIGEGSKVMLIAFSTFFFVYVTTVDAVRGIDPILLRAAQTLGMSRLQSFRYVTVRGIAPQILVGVRLALSTAWFLVVGAEFIAADSGLGYLINFSRIWFRVGDMIAAAAVIGVLGLLSNYVLILVERRAFSWRERAYH
ncbi:MAG: ABC transporter permease [Actinomycetota bacterium]